MWNVCLMGPYDQTDGMGTSPDWFGVLVLMIEHAESVVHGDRSFFIYWSEK